MRVEFADAMVRFADKYPEMVFVTGDLGYMALEKVREQFGDRFINAGVAEQNMVTMSAGLAHAGLKPWLYSIAPFITLRPYEQIRNDICLHNLPVKLVGNGGGYGYGIMGSTHHTLEDIGVMRALPNMRAYIPFVANDVEQAMIKMAADNHPNYLRLNLAARVAQQVPSFSMWRRITAGDKAVVIGTGPVVENILTLDHSLLNGLDVWLVSEFPITEVPDELIETISIIRNVITIEEHYDQCGLRETMGALLLSKLKIAIRYNNLFASGYPSGRYGSQRWHQAENNLGGEGLIKKLNEFLR